MTTYKKLSHSHFIRIYFIFLGNCDKKEQVESVTDLSPIA